MKTPKKDFIAEAEELIEDINERLLELQSNADPEILNSIFRSVHTMKGISGLFGMKSITDLSHTLESLLDDLRLGKIEISDDTINFIFGNVDILKNLVNQVVVDKGIDDISDSIREIEEFRKTARVRRADKEVSFEDLGIDPSIIRVLSEYEEHRLKTNIKEGKGLYFIKAVFALADFAPQLEALSSSVKKLGEIIATLPSSEDVPEGSLGFKLMFGSFSKKEEIMAEASSAYIEEVFPPKRRTETKTVRSKDVSLKSTTNIVKVDIEKLDGILNTVSELVLAKGAVVRIGHELAEDLSYNPLVHDIHKISQILERKLIKLQGQVLGLRMVPFSQIFARLAQVVRRYTREIGKKIELEFFGEDTEIDKLLAEETIDPLIHIVRNAIDHGIEPGDKRVSSGKKEHGTITLRAFPKGNNVMIEIKDDGAGLDLDKILSKAVASKLIPGGKPLDHREIIDLIFLPGLSTKEEVSEVSGRGVGMNIVKEKITSFGGFVDIETEKGVGTSVILTLPTTLAVIKALIVQVASERFAIPLSSISETFFVDPQKIQTIEGREVIEARGEMLPLLRVASVFVLDEKPRDEYFAVIVGFGSRRRGLLVDNLLEQTEVVVKHLGEHLRNIRGLAGAAEIGKHEIVLVLDVEAMMEEAFSRK